MFFLIHKPLGLSSFQAIARLRKRLGIKKIGHTGTLDPLATGLLLVATDHSTKLIPYIDKARKTYVFTVRLDGTTDSLDLDTPIRPLDPALVARIGDSLTTTQIEEVLRSDFSGLIRQIPPVYSALNIDGKRAYELARAGQEVEMKERTAEIYSWRILDFAFPEVTIEMEVSVGTYIRSIARDLGAKLWLAGYVTRLHRSRIGHLGEDLACEIDDVDTKVCLSYATVLPDLPIISPDEEALRKIRNGIVFPNTLGLVPGQKYFVRDGEKHVSIIEACDGEARVRVNNVE